MTPIKKNVSRGWRDAQWLTATTALPEVLGSIPSTNMAAHNRLVLGDPVPSSGLLKPVRECGVQAEHSST